MELIDNIVSHDVRKRKFTDKQILKVLILLQIFSALMISSSIENVLSISHLREYREEYSLLRSIPILRFTDSLSGIMPLLLFVSIMGKECVFSNT